MRKAFSLLTIVLFLVACAPAVTATPAPEATQVPPATATFAPTAIATDSPTLVPENELVTLANQLGATNIAINEELRLAVISDPSGYSLFSGRYNMTTIGVTEFFDPSFSGVNLVWFDEEHTGVYTSNFNEPNNFINWNTDGKYTGFAAFENNSFSLYADGALYVSDASALGRLNGQNEIFTELTATTGDNPMVAVADMTTERKIRVYNGNFQELRTAVPMNGSQLSWTWNTLYSITPNGIEAALLTETDYIGLPSVACVINESVITSYAVSMIYQVAYVTDAHQVFFCQPGNSQPMKYGMADEVVGFWMDDLIVKDGHIYRAIPIPYPE